MKISLYTRFYHPLWSKWTPVEHGYLVRARPWIGWLYTIKRYPARLRLRWRMFRETLW